MSRFFAGQQLWDELRSRASRSRNLTVCVGFVGRHPERLLKWRRGSRLVTNVTAETVARGACSARGALRLLKQGVEVHQAPDLHAKVYLFDSSAIVCSANASLESRDRLEEAGVLVTGAAVAAVRSWVRRLLEADDTTCLDSDALRALARLEPETKPRSRSKPPKRGAGPLERLMSRDRVWLIGVSLDQDETADEKRAARASAKDLVANGTADSAANLDWINACEKRIHKRVRPGDMIIQAWAPMARSPNGRIEGPSTCIATVDLGSRFRDDRRRRVAVSSKRVWSRRILAPDLRQLERLGGVVLRRRGTHKGFQTIRALSENERRHVARLLRMK